MLFVNKTTTAKPTDLMKIMFAGWPNVCQFIRDIILARDTWDLQVMTLGIVSQMLWEASLSRKPEKVEIGR